MKVSSNKGLIIELDGVKLSLDCGAKADLGFISHAHTDHLIKKKTDHSFIISEATKSLSEHRSGVKIKCYEKDYFKGLKFKMIDNGHVFGSKALLIEGSEKVLYTSDFTTRDRFFLKGFKPVKCDTLIIETTYGQPCYNFPSIKEIVSSARQCINDWALKGNNLVLNGYALGKAQIISKIVEDYDNVYVDNNVKAINDICRSHGADLPYFNKGKPNEPFILISPSPHYEFKAKRLGFSGWGAFNGSDKCLKLSDHADFKELLSVVKACKPTKVYTNHGFSDEFAELLRLEGYDAKAI